MDISIITDALIKQTLTAFQQAKTPPAEMLALAVLRQFGGQSTDERQIHLRDWMYETIQSYLQQQHEADGRPFQPLQSQTRQQIITALAADFAHNNVENRSME